MSLVTKKIVLFLLVFLPITSNACSIGDINLWLQNSIEQANYYWFLSTVIAFITILINYFSLKSKELFLLPLLTILFYPAWTIDHSFGMDCRSGSVVFSKAAVVFLSLLLLYLIYRCYNLIWPAKLK